MVKTLCSQCRGLDLTPEQGARSHILQPRVHMLQLRLIKVYIFKRTEGLDTAKEDIKMANKHTENDHHCYQETPAKGHHWNS